MQNAVIYARFSSHGQNEQSIDGQVEECQQYCEQMGFNVVGIYHDNAISGKFDEKRSEPSSSNCLYFLNSSAALVSCCNGAAGDGLFIFDCIKSLICNNLQGGEITNTIKA